MDRPDLPLNGLRVFEAAFRQGSFTRAAIELRVTQAAVSHQVARLGRQPLIDQGPGLKRPFLGVVTA
jgi:hypothetical protein